MIICMYVNVCMYIICIYIYMCVCVYLYIYIYTHIYTHVCLFSLRPSYTTDHHGFRRSCTSHAYPIVPDFNAQRSRGQEHQAVETNHITKGAALSHCPPWHHALHGVDTFAQGLRRNYAEVLGEFIWLIQPLVFMDIHAIFHVDRILQLDRASCGSQAGLD